METIDQPVETTTQSGFFGKIPSHGDFINRRVSRMFLDAWDSWLQQCLSRSQENLGGAWLDIYLTSPLWRFYLSPGVAGEHAMTGIMMPSVDKVGRYFPLCITAEIQDNIASCDSAFANNWWYNTAEELALTTLKDDFDFDTFDKQVEELELLVTDSATMGHIDQHPCGAMHLPLGSVVGASAPPSGLAHHFLTLAHSSEYSLWWTSGSQRMQSCIIACTQLPSADGYTALLDGQWNHWGWYSPSSVNPAGTASIDNMWNL